MKVLKTFKLLLLFDMCLVANAGQQETTFKDKTSELKLKLGNAAVACIDYNNDGYVDLYTTGKLWKNNLGKRFSKVKAIDEKDGRAVWADYDNDGYSDFYVCRDSGTQQLFWNNEGEDFVLQSFPELSMKSSRGASWADFNDDGYVDLYIGGYENWSSDPNRNVSYPDAIILNIEDPEKKGCRKFKIKEKQKKEQLHGVNGRARGITCCDFDEDGDIDIYVSNYRLQPNQLLLNDGKGNFNDVAKEHEVAGQSDIAIDISKWLMIKGKIEEAKHFKRLAKIRPKEIIKGFHGFTIGSAWADLDNDGYFDLFVGNFIHISPSGDSPLSPPEDRPLFYRNMGPSYNYHFQEKSHAARLIRPQAYASPAFGDYDNDGDLDLYLTTAPYVKHNHPVLYRNEGNWYFTDVTEKEGLSQLEGTYQAAWADFDNDGDLDLITDGKLFENQGNTNNWLKVHLQGDGKRVNRSAIGAQVRIKLKDRTLTRQVEAGTGEGNQNDLTLHFGLGKNEGPVELEVYWPNVKEKQKIQNVDVNQQTIVTFQKS